MNRAAGWFVEVELRMLATRTDLQREYPDRFSRPVRYTRWSSGPRLPVMLNHGAHMIGTAEVVGTPTELRMFISINGSVAARPVRELLGRGGIPGASPRITGSDSPLARGNDHVVQVGTLREISLLVDDSGRPLPGALGDACRVVSIDRLTMPEVAERAAGFAELRASGVAAVDRLERNLRIRADWKARDEGIQRRDAPYQEQRA